MRAFFAIPIAMLAMLVVAPRPGVAAALTYDFSGTLRLSPVPGSTDALARCARPIPGRGNIG